MRTIVALALIVAVSAWGAPQTFYSRTVVPKGWQRGGFAPAEETINVMIGLKQQNKDVLENLFWSVSNPKSEQYQQYMSIDEILSIVEAPAAAQAVVMKWLAEAGVKAINRRDAVEARLTMAQAERLFGTKMYTFIHSERGQKVHLAWGDMSLPAEVHAVVDVIEGLSLFPIDHLKAKIYAPEAGTLGVVPQTLQELYAIPPQKQNGAATTSVGVIEFQAQCYAPADLSAFSQNVDIPITPLTKAHTIGPNDPTNPQIEAALDIEQVSSIDNAAESWFWLENGNNWLLQFGQHFFSTATVPQVISISYGWSESDQCDIDTYECQKLGINSQQYVERVNVEFQKIALRGISILVASGDSGANGRTDPDCSGSTLLPDYPTASPYITSVGATQLNNPKFALTNPPPVCNGQGYSCASGGQEVAVSYAHAQFASGGGFSNVAAMPSYQTAAVTAYLKSGVALPPASYFNATGRAYPDVAAIGSDVLINQGGVQPVGGTSCSAPEFAAVVAILNQAAIAKTGKPLGFLNQLIYQMGAECPTCFHDITVGDNKCTEDGCSPSCKGYLATKGWDPVTGLGSPNYPAMLAYIQANL